MWDVSESAISKAYRRASLAVHPDKNPLPEAKAAFDKLNDAVRALRDALAREEDSNKHKLVAKELSQQANYIGDGIVEEEAFSSAAHKGEVVHSVQEQGAHAASKHSARLAHSSAASAAAKGSSGSSRAHGQERSLVAKALQERAAAGREERQWQAQPLQIGRAHV